MDMLVSATRKATQPRADSTKPYSAIYLNKLWETIMLHLASLIKVHTTATIRKSILRYDFAVLLTWHDRGKAGRSRVGQDETEQGRTEQGRVEQCRAERVRVGPGRADQSRAGMGRAGLGKAGLGRMG